MGNPDLGPGFGFAVPTLFGIVFALISTVVLVMFVVVIVVAIRNARRVRRSGHDPLTLQSDLAVRALDGEMMRPRRSTEERLAELQELHRKGAISSDELVTARARVLGGSEDR